MRTIGIEEHYVPEQGMDFSFLPAQVQKRIRPSTDERLADMDAAGVDLQVVSSSLPVTELTPAEYAVPRAQAANRHVHRMTTAHPDRFRGFATLPVSVPDAAAIELERAVNELGFVGTMISGNVAGRFLDDRFFTPILETAERLDVPIYLHPGLVPKPVAEDYYSGFSSAVNQNLGGGGYGWHYEVSMHSLRMILGGVFDRLPGLKLIIGHLGEGIPFHIQRIDEQLNPVAEQLTKPVSSYFKDHFWFTTSGYIYDGPFRLARQMMGDDRLLFSVDYPFSENKAARNWFDHLGLPPQAREKIAHGNAEGLLRLPGIFQ